MFGLGKKNKIDKVFRLINQDQHFSKINAENFFSREDIIEIYDLSRDVNTTVTLALLLQQSVVAQRMESKAPYEKIALGFIELALEQNLDARTIIEQEVNGYVESAKYYGNAIADKLDSGRIISNQEVRGFCANHAETMLVSWMRYRLNLISVFEDKFNN